MFTRIIRTLIIGTTLLQALPAQAAVTDAQIGDNAVFFTLFPALRLLPAPPLITNGLRVSYSSASAGGGVGGAGVIQYDVVAQDISTVMLYQHNYADIGAGVIPLAQTVARGAPALGPFWIHPAVLAGAESIASGTLTVTRYQKQVAGSLRTVVRFQTDTSNGGRVVTEFSAASGLMVFSSIKTLNGDAQLVLLSARPLRIPWRPDAAPRWARPGATLQYSGTKTTMIPGAVTTRQPLTATVSVNEATIGWTTFQVSQTLDGQPLGPGETVSGVAQLNGSYWLPRAALVTALPATPTTIDVDPVTGARTTLSAGNGAIVLQQLLSGASTRWTYDTQFGAIRQIVLQTAGVAASEERSLSLVGGSNLRALSLGPELPGGSGSSGGSLPPPAASILPASRSVSVGSTATAFATLINPGSTALRNCGIGLATAVPAMLSFQTTDPATNALTGAPNTPVTIAPGGAQSYVLALTPSQPLAPTEVAFNFICTDTSAAAVVVGLNTLLLSAASSPVADVVALGATPTADGILDLPGINGAGAFSVATVNVGAAADVSVKADTGGRDLGLTLKVCRSNPANGQCLTAPTGEVQTTIGANETPTFSVFATASRAVAFDPANHRIRVSFSEGGTTRGATSVAVRTR